MHMDIKLLKTKDTPSKKDLLNHKLSNSCMNQKPISQPSLIVHGPEGCGKTRNSLAMATAFGLNKIIDNAEDGADLPILNALILTKSEISHPQIDRISFKEAMNIVRPRQ